MSIQPDLAAAATLVGALLRTLRSMIPEDGLVVMAPRGLVKFSRDTSIQHVRFDLSVRVPDV